MVNELRKLAVIGDIDFARDAVFSDYVVDDSVAGLLRQVEDMTQSAMRYNHIVLQMTGHTPAEWNFEMADVPESEQFDYLLSRFPNEVADADKKELMDAYIGMLESAGRGEILAERTASDEFTGSHSRDWVLIGAIREKYLGDVTTEKQQVFGRSFKTSDSQRISDQVDAVQGMVGSETVIDDVTNQEQCGS